MQETFLDVSGYLNRMIYYFWSQQWGGHALPKTRPPPLIQAKNPSGTSQTGEILGDAPVQWHSDDDFRFRLHGNFIQVCLKTKKRRILKDKTIAIFEGGSLWTTCPGDNKYDLAVPWQVTKNTYVVLKEKNKPVDVNNVCSIKDLLDGPDLEKIFNTGIKGKEKKRSITKPGENDKDGYPWCLC